MIRTDKVRKARMLPQNNRAKITNATPPANSQGRIIIIANATRAHLIKLNLPILSKFLIFSIRKLYNFRCENYATLRKEKRKNYR